MSFDEPPRIPGKKDDPKQIGAWKMGRTIGKGSSGRVKLARHAKTGQMAAVKIVSKSFLYSHTESLDELASEAEYKELSLQREIIVMKLIEHPNVMRLYDVWDLPDEIYLILEYVQGGELFDYLCEKGRLPVPEALSYFQQIIFAVDYCHRFNIAHRDLKPENILLDAEFNVKIADFGMAIFQSDSMLRTSCGSPHYAAPEVVSGGAYDGTKADIWSCGIILHALLVGRLPFDHEDCGVLLQMVGDGKFDMPRDIPALAQDLLRRMLTKDVKRRITMTQIQAHPFFTSQQPKISPQCMPNLESIAQPLRSANDIDPEIFNNLRTFWKDSSEETLMSSLTSSDRNWQKGIYYLLTEYRRKRLEDYDQRKEIARNERLHRRKTRAARRMAEKKASEAAQERDIRPSPSSLPPRDGPPTPRRASRGGRISPSSSHSAVWRHPAQFHESTPIHSPQMSFVSPNLALMNEIIGDSTMHPSSAPRAQPMADSLAVAADVFSDTPDDPTQPLTIRRKDRPVHLAIDINFDSEDKENLDGSFLIVDPSALSPTRKQADDPHRQSDLKHIQIVDHERPRRRRSKLKKLRDSRFSSSSSDSAPSPTTPFAYTTDSLLSPTVYPRANWFTNMFKFRPYSCTLTSTHNVHTTRNECRRLLMDMDVRVVLEESEGLGVLKCKMEETRDSAGMVLKKATKFRVEVREVGGGPLDSALSLVLIHERGSIDRFREGFDRLKREWILHAVGSKTPEQVVELPAGNGEARFTTLAI
ncbi:serine/threonine-protein kinase gin4 [Marasmius crinis-equi]|uniref:Serine/threonine-protein kinase gin4 n=1 Tax=Marasmius crinis-equi TaxID=585013 RepID=A0ABR3F6X5_9AGAR